MSLQAGSPCAQPLGLGYQLGGWGWVTPFEGRRYGSLAGVGDGLPGEKTEVASEGWSHRDEPPARPPLPWALTCGGTAARVMLIQVVLQCVPATTHTHHHVAPQHLWEPRKGWSQPVPRAWQPTPWVAACWAAPHSYSHKDEQARVSHAVLPLRDLDHGKLVWAGAVAQDLPYLRPERKG